MGGASAVGRHITLCRPQPFGLNACHAARVTARQRADNSQMTVNATPLRGDAYEATAAWRARSNHLTNFQLLAGHAAAAEMSRAKPKADYDDAHNIFAERTENTFSP